MTGCASTNVPVGSMRRMARVTRVGEVAPSFHAQMKFVPVHVTPSCWTRLPPGRTSLGAASSHAPASDIRRAMMAIGVAG